MTQPKIEGVGHGVPRMIYGSDGSNWYAVLVDSDGHVKIDVVAYPGSNALGNFPFGYYDRYLEVDGDTNTPAGTVTKTLTAVPAGEVWVIHGIEGINVNTNTAISLRVSNGTTDFILLSTTPAAANTWVFWTGSVVMKAGDYVKVMFTGCTLNDDTYWRAIGYKMKVA